MEIIRAYCVNPALRGGWFAAPGPGNYRGVFLSAMKLHLVLNPRAWRPLVMMRHFWRRDYHKNPRKRDRFSATAITDPNGYFGADGLFRLRFQRRNRARLGYP